MRYANALKYMKDRWPNTWHWVVRTVGGPGCKDEPKINMELAVPPSTNDHVLLSQCGILVWIASDRPVNQPAHNWPGSANDIRKRFVDMSDSDLKSYLDSVESTMETPAPPPIPPRPQHLVAAVQQGQNVSRQPNPVVQPMPVSQPPQPRANVPVNANVNRPVLRPQSPPPPQLNRPSPPVQTSAPSYSPPQPRRLSKGPAPAGFTKSADMMQAIEKMDDLKKLFICDIPTGTAGVYLTEPKSSGLVDNSKIILGKGDKPEGWLKLGKGVLTNRMGKCWSCAAAVIYKLVADPRFDGIRIESIGAVSFDHHFVAINRASNTDPSDMKTWNKDVVLIDAWQANLKDWWVKPPSDSPKQTQLCYTLSDFPYKGSKVVHFCEFSADQRALHRSSLEEVGKFVQGQVVTQAWKDLVEAAKRK